MKQDEFLARFNNILRTLDKLAETHDKPDEHKARNETYWFVFGKTMVAVHSHLEAIGILAKEMKHAQVAVISRSVMELMGLFIWATADESRAKAYKGKVLELQRDLNEVWQKLINGEASELSKFGQPKNDESYRELILQSGLHKDNAKVLDINYDELSLYVHPSPIMSTSFANKDEQLSRHYTKPALFSTHMILARAKDLLIADTELLDKLRIEIMKLVEDIASEAVEDPAV